MWLDFGYVLKIELVRKEPGKTQEGIDSMAVEPESRSSGYANFKIHIGN
jgi:hypothetical protein